MKKLRPILFSTPMVQAILEGRKTQTRRVVEPQPKSWVTDLYPEETRDFKGQTGRWILNGKTEKGRDWATGFINCRYGKVGDVLWVRESWNGVKDLNGKFSHYRFKGDNDPFHNGMRWKPSIHMPFEAARIFLKITDVRVERLQDITQQDSISEGIECIDHGAYWKNYDLKSEIKCYLNANHSFESLWQSINGKDSWNANPWVWVVEFKRIAKEEVTNERTK